MKYYENTKVAQDYLARIEDMLEGRREMPPVYYPPRGDNYHLSDFQGCPLPGFFRRAMNLKPPLSKKSLLYFLTGRIIERAIANEFPSGEVEGISFTVDDCAPDGIPAELKSTRWGSGFFDPVKDQPAWIERIKGYCYCRKSLIYHLVVVFLHGNVGDFFPWTIKKNGGRKPDSWENVDLKAWTFEFEQKEIDDNWAEVLRRRDVLDESVKSGSPMSDDEVLSRRPVWECKECSYRGVCHVVANE